MRVRVRVRVRVGAVLAGALEGACGGRVWWDRVKGLAFSIWWDRGWWDASARETLCESAPTL